MTGALLHHGVRVTQKRVRASLARVDGPGVEQRRYKATKRRVYNNRVVDHMWHIGNPPPPTLIRATNVGAMICTLWILSNAAFVMILPGSCLTCPLTIHSYSANTAPVTED